MKVLRIVLLLFMSLILFMMVGFPGSYDSKRRFAAQRHYSEAPSEETGREIAEAKKLDARDIRSFEFKMLGVLGLSFYAFTRAGKGVQNNAAA
jgi:hypothetical protein